MTAKAKAVGRTARVGARMGYEVFEALAPTQCQDCGREIAIGENFTRRPVAGGGRARYDICGNCSDAVVAE